MTHLIPEQTSNPRDTMLSETPRCAVLLCSLIVWFVAAAGAMAQPMITEIRQLTNREVRLQLAAPTGSGYRVDAASDPTAWSSLITVTGATTSLVVTDTAAPFLPIRFYRAEQLSLIGLVTGDHLPTSEGDVVVHPLYHASTLLTWNGKAIYVDPDDDAAYESTYAGLPKADLVLVTHSHGDHFSSGKIEALRKTNTLIIVPQAVFTSLATAQKTNAIVLTNSASTNVLGLKVEAVPAYNSNHPIGTGNGYVLTIGGRRLYFSGDTGNVPEIRALQSIDLAFLCMNTPFTMTPTEATNCIRAMRPRIVYPYHYRNQSGTTTNAAYFRQVLGTDLGIEVRLRKWY